MRDRTKKSIADTLETGENLLTFMPFLLQDLWALGSAVDQIVDAIGSLDLPPESAQILDLGCGKGAVIILIASKYGFRVTGVDAMEDFLNVARTKADAFGVSSRCEFINMDIKDFVTRERDFDAVILASLGGLFGSFIRTVEIMRTQIKSGGYILIDDGYLRRKKNVLRKGYGHYRDYDTTISELTACEDVIVDEISTTDCSKKINREYLTHIVKRGKELILMYPALSDELMQFIRTQEEECDIIDREIEGVLWVIRKGEGK